MKHRLSQQKYINIFGLTTPFIIFIALSVIAGWVLFSKKSGLPKYNGPVEKVSTGVVGEYSSLSIIAQEQGYFKANGLDVKLVNYESGPPAVADVLAGKIDTATAAEFVGVSNSFNNKDLRILATQGRTNSFFLVVRTDHGIRETSDLKGKRIGVTGKSAGEFYLGQYLILNQISTKDITIVKQTPTELVDSLTQGKLDAIITFDPHISQAKRQLKNNVSVWQLQGEQRLSTMLYGTSGLTKQRPEVIERYLRALVQAENYVRLHNDDARNIVGEYLHYDEPYMTTVWSHISFDVSLDQDLLITMEDQARWSIENKLTTATTIPDFLNYIYFDGLEAVKPDGITIIR
jgi:NitT/TauT family transport system substrate-binding protein